MPDFAANIPAVLIRRDLPVLHTTVPLGMAVVQGLHEFVIQLEPGQLARIGEDLAMVDAAGWRLECRITAVDGLRRTATAISKLGRHPLAVLGEFTYDEEGWRPCEYE